MVLLTRELVIIVDTMYRVVKLAAKLQCMFCVVSVVLLDTANEPTLEWTRYPYGPAANTPGVSSTILLRFPMNTNTNVVYEFIPIAYLSLELTALLYR